MLQRRRLGWSSMYHTAFAQPYHGCLCQKNGPCFGRFLPNRNFNVWCVDRTVDEGRKAAMRWLIEFIGLILKPGKPAKNGKFAENEKAAAPTPHPNGKSVTIRQVGGIMFDTTRQDALKLAKIWQACSQASLHPTMDTKHDRLTPNDLASALQIVLARLETGLYGPAGRDLCKIVHEQEELAILRAG